MLTADLVAARRHGAELRLAKLDARTRVRALEIATAMLAQAAACVGQTREDLHLALDAVSIDPREQRLRNGLAKLIEDVADFDANDETDAPGIREAVFQRASRDREALDPGARFDRSRVLAEVAADRGVDPGAIDRALFADLRGSHRLVAFRKPSAQAFLDRYERAQAQAVLLRAVRVVVDVDLATPSALRALFRKLKFLRLLYTLERTDRGYRVVVDGPFSIFESVTKYGMRLALLVPALEECDRWRLQADIRWGKERAPLTFRLEGEAAGGRAGHAPLPDEVRALAKTFAALGTRWSVADNRDILDLPGVGLCVPDLVFERAEGPRRERVYLEVMGYWSRDAVWKRVELVQAGLAERVIFAVGASLRVSEAVLADDQPSALYVYKKTMNARSIAERLERMAGPRLAT